jgi:ERCC4-type nuclease
VVKETLCDWNQCMTTLWVDSRTGSKELLPLLRHTGIRAELATLDCGDFAVTGNGPEGQTEVGFERKTYGDLIDSLRSGRLAGDSMMLAPRVI